MLPYSLGVGGRVKCILFKADLDKIHHCNNEEQHDASREERGQLLGLVNGYL